MLALAGDLIDDKTRQALMAIVAAWTISQGLRPTPARVND
jgi:hypothetical protein